MWDYECARALRSYGWLVICGRRGYKKWEGLPISGNHRVEQSGFHFGDTFSNRMAIGWVEARFF